MWFTWSLKSVEGDAEAARVCLRILQGLRGIWGTDRVAALQSGDVAVPGTGDRDRGKMTLIELYARYRAQIEAASENGAGPLVIDGELQDAHDAG